MAEISHPQQGHRSAKIRSKKFPTRIDMTPMVDLAFLLLTFFILTTTLNKMMVMQIVVPEKAQLEPQPINESRVLTLVLGEKDNVYWRRGMSDAFDRIDYSQIKKLLAAKKIEINRMALFIKSTSKCRFQNFVDVMDDVKAAEIDPYYIVDSEPADEQLIREADLRSASTSATPAKN